MEGFREVIDSDLYGVARRIKEIDNGYFLVFNHKTRKYEVHNLKSTPNTLALVSPFETLDVRLLHLVRATRRERASEIVEAIERQNEKIEKEKTAQVMDNAKERLKEALQKYKSA